MHSPPSASVPVAREQPVERRIAAIASPPCSLRRRRPLPTETVR